MCVCVCKECKTLDSELLLLIRFFKPALHKY